MWADWAHQRYVDAIRESWIASDRSHGLGLADRRHPTLLQVLTADADTPFIDEAYHVAIVWNALRKMAISEVAEEPFCAVKMSSRRGTPFLCQKYISQSLSFGGWGNL